MFVHFVQSQWISIYLWSFTYMNSFICPPVNSGLSIIMKLAHENERGCMSRVCVWFSFPSPAHLDVFVWPCESACAHICSVWLCVCMCVFPDGDESDWLGGNRCQLVLAARKTEQSQSRYLPVQNAQQTDLHLITICDIDLDYASLIHMKTPSSHPLLGSDQENHWRRWNRFQDEQNGVCNVICPCCHCSLIIHKPLLEGTTGNIRFLKVFHLKVFIVKSVITNLAL